MDNSENNQQRQRKEYSPKGQRSQKMISFRIDIENAEWLDLQPNKGRYLNMLIAADREKH